MSIPLELHVALVRLDAELAEVRRSIQAVMQGALAHSLHDVGAVQCRLLEDALREQAQGKAPCFTGVKAARTKKLLPTGLLTGAPPQGVTIIPPAAVPGSLSPER